MKSKIKKLQISKRSFLTIALLGFAIMVCGCGPKNYLNDNDKLRASNMHLKQRVKKLNKNLKLQKGYNQSLEKKLHPKTKNMPKAQVPVLSALKLGLFSGVMDKNSNPKLQLRLLTVDQKGRMLPIAGKAKLTVAINDKNGNPKIIAKKNYTPSQLDSAYRATITSTHYLFTLPLKKDVLDKVNHIIVNVIITQAQTGRVLTLQKIYSTKQ